MRFALHPKLLKAIEQVGSGGTIQLGDGHFASGFSDVLEWVAKKYGFLHEAAPAFVAPLPDYSVSFISNEMLSTGLSGLIGVIISFAVAWTRHRFLSLIIVRQQIA